jgi:rhodanese-related sulfurtransferase
MQDVLRIPPEEARPKVLDGEALLVCAYEDPSSFRSMRLEGGISVREFRDRLSSLGKEKEIVFYCA